MLSILIPVFNRPVAALAEALYNECERIRITWEIVIVDDGSTTFTEVNARLGELQEIKYTAFRQNIGRAAIRNRLGEMAAYDYLLYLDCDSMPVSQQFVQTYIRNFGKGVVYGGRVYPKPPSKAHLLHYRYGVKREALPQVIRARDPYKYFQTNNFLIPKSVFEQVRFDESLKQYGHEDTLFGKNLKEKGIELLHIDNPVVHEGLEHCDEFLAKARLSIQNALQLYREGKLSGHDIRAVGLYARLRSHAAGRLILRELAGLERSLEKNLRSNRPSMRNLDLLKLVWLLREDALQSASKPD